MVDVAAPILSRRGFEALEEVLATPRQPHGDGGVAEAPVVAAAMKAGRGQWISDGWHLNH